MKTTRHILARIAIALAVMLPLSIPILTTGCATPANERVAAVNTLKAAGHSAEAVVELSARLYASGQIDAAKAREVADFYDMKWQPAFRLAVTAAHGDLSTVASPDVWDLLAQLSALLPPPKTATP